MDDSRGRFWQRYSLVVSLVLAVVGSAAFLHAQSDAVRRLRLVVSAAGAARIDFLDQEGRAILSLPDSAAGH